MPQIPVWEKQVGVERAVAPEIPQGWLTEEYRAMAQAGEAVGGLADVMQKLQEQETRTKLREQDARNSAVRMGILQQYNDEYIEQEYGEGEIFEWATDPTDPTKKIAKPTGRQKKKFNQLATDFMGDFDKLIAANEDKYLTDIPEHYRRRYQAQSEIERNNLALWINEKQVDAVGKAAERAVVAQTLQQMEGLKAGDPPDIVLANIEAVLKDGVVTTDISPEKASNLLSHYQNEIKRLVKEQQQALQDAQKEAEQAAIKGFVDFYVDNPEKGLDEIAVSKDFDGAQKREITSQLNLAKARRDQKREQDQTNAGIAALGIISSGKLPIGYSSFDQWLTLSPLNPTGENGRAHYRSLWQQEADRKAKGEPSIFDQNDPATQLELLKRINLEPEKLDANKNFYSLVGTGKLSLGEAQQLEIKLDAAKKALEPGAVPKSEVVARAEGLMDTLERFDLSINHKDSDVDTIREVKKRYLKRRTSFYHWLKENTDENGKILVSDEEINKKALIITEPLREEIKLGWFSKLIRPKKELTVPFTKFKPLITIDTEAKALAKKIIKELKDTYTWDNWTEKERAKAEELINQGKEINDVIAEVNSGE